MFPVIKPVCKSSLVLVLVASLICVLKVSQGQKQKEAYIQQTSFLVKQFGEWSIYYEIGKFLTDAREKLDTDCATIVWDYGFSTVLDNLKLCGEGDLRQPCVPLYTVLYKDVENMTDDVIRTLKEGYRRKCGGYIFVLQSTSAVVDLLHYGDDYRVINTHARFLIWYGVVDKAFETNDIWKKVPNVILFHTKLGYRARKRMTFTIKGFKWPILPNTVDTTRVVDFWSQGKYFGRSVESWYRDKTNDLKNITLRVLAVEHPPGVIKYEKPDSDKVVYAGSEVEIVKELSSIMNFDYEFLEVEPETKWGGQVSTNFTPQFFGAVARLIYGEADMAIGSFFVLKHYLDFLDMSIPLDVACTSFLTPNPLSRPRYLALILPFNYKLWALVLSICFIFAPFGLYVLSKLPVHSTEYRIFTGRSQVVFTCFSIMSQVALHLWPKFWPVRMFVGWFWMFCLLITLAYRGAMVSFLTIPLFENPIDNINDLASSGLRIGGWGTELHRLFKQYTSTNGQSSIKTALRERYEMIDDVNTAVSWIAMGEFALYENIRFLKFTRQTRNLTRLGYPSMRIMKQCIVPVHIGIAYQKNSPIVPTINRHIRRFQESGLMKRWSQRLVTQTKLHYQKLEEEENNLLDDHHHEDGSDSEDDEEDGDDAAASGSSNTKQRKQRVLNMRDLQGSIYLIFFGFFLSITAFIVEIFVAHSHAAAKNVNKELKKIKDKAKGKGTFLDDFNKAGGEGNNESGAAAALDGGSRTAKKGDALITSKNQFLANMLMEYEGVVRMQQQQQLLQKSESQKEEKIKNFLRGRKRNRDSVRVKTSDNREEFFTYMQ